MTGSILITTINIGYKGKNIEIEIRDKEFSMDNNKINNK